MVLYVMALRHGLKWAVTGAHAAKVKLSERGNWTNLTCLQLLRFSAEYFVRDLIDLIGCYKTLNLIGKNITNKSEQELH